MKITLIFHLIRDKTSDINAHLQGNKSVFWARKYVILPLCKVRVAKSKKRLRFWIESRKSYVLPRCRHCMQRGLVTNHDKAVRPFVCLYVRLSDKRASCEKTKERNLCPHFYTTSKSIHPSFLTRRMAGGGWLLLPEMLGHWPRCSENADFQSILARSASAVTPSKKVQLTLIGSPLHAFQRV